MGSQHNSTNENELELSKFGEFLLLKRLVPERNARYFVFWVRKFLHQVPDSSDLNLQDRMQIFLDSLRKTNSEDWQISQAERAIRDTGDKQVILLK